MKYPKKISVNISQNTLNQIFELQKHHELMKWDPTISDIIRVSVSNYWEDMFTYIISENKSLTNKEKTPKIKE